MHANFSAKLSNDIESVKNMLPVSCWERARIHSGFGRDLQRGRDIMDCYGWTEYCAFHYRDDDGNHAHMSALDGSIVVVLAHA